VQCVQGIEHDGRRAGAGQGGGDFASDVSGFTDAKHDHFAARVHRIFDISDGAGKIFAQPLTQPLKLTNLNI
jgi:hypothetical protein